MKRTITFAALIMFLVLLSACLVGPQEDTDTGGDEAMATQDPGTPDLPPSLEGTDTGCGYQSVEVSPGVEWIFPLECDSRPHVDTGDPMDENVRDQGVSDPWSW